MKRVKRWIAFCVVVLLLIGLASGVRGPLFADQKQETEQGIDVTQEVELGREEAAEVTKKEAKKEAAEETKKITEEQSEDTKKSEENKTEDTRTEDSKSEENKTEDTRTEDSKTEENKTEQPEKLSEKEEEPEENLVFRTESEEITLTEVQKGAIPQGASLRVVPVLKDDKETLEQYKEVEKQLSEKAEEEQYEIAGFLAYDIAVVDNDGMEIEPNGKVKVSITYKKAVLPDEVQDKESAGMEVSILHLEEDDRGQVKKVADLKEKDTKGRIEKLETTKAKEVKEAEFVTESFSVYTLTWRNGQNWNSSRSLNISFNRRDERGNSVGTNASSTITANTATVNFSDPAYTTIAGYRYAGSYRNYSNQNYSNEVQSARLESDGGRVRVTYTYANGTTGTQTYNNGSTITIYQKYVPQYTVNFYRNSRNTEGTGHLEQSITLQSVNYEDENGNTYQAVVVPLPNTTSDTTDGYAFYGWSKTQNANTTPSSAIYSPTAVVNYGTTPMTYGSTDVVVFRTSEFTSGTLNLYGIYAVDGQRAQTGDVGGTKVIKYYIRLDGTIPSEPASMNTGLYSDANRSSAYDSSAVHYYQHIYNNPDALAANIIRQPGISELSYMVANKSFWIGGRQYSPGQFDPNTMYVEWYVMKREPSDNWHIDGVLLSNELWTLAYDANTSEHVQGVINAEQYTYQNNAEVYNSYTNNQKSEIPLKRSGYVFTGWNTRPDGSGTAVALHDHMTVDSAGNVYQNGTATGEQLTRTDTSVAYKLTLYAQWADSSADPERPFLRVKKTFAGIADPAAVFPDYRILLARDGETTATLKLTDPSNVLSSKTNADGSKTYTWIVNNEDAESYQVQENNAQVSDFQLEAEVNGGALTPGNPIPVTTNAMSYQIRNFQQITSVQSNYTISSASNYVAAQLSDGTYCVWTADRLSAKERKGLVQAIRASATGGFADVSDPEIYFFSRYDAADSHLLYNGGISVHTAGNATVLHPAHANLWSKLYTGTCEKQEPDSAEITVKNTYTRNAVLLKKVGTADAVELIGAQFRLTQGTVENHVWSAAGEPQSIDMNDVFEYPLESLSAGYVYKLEEVTAPDGYSCLDRPIYLKIEVGGITLMEGDDQNLTPSGDGQILQSETDAERYMCRLTEDTLIVRNDTLYALPQSGGSGIYLYVIGGMLLMMAGVWFRYKSRDKSLWKQRMQKDW